MSKLKRILQLVLVIVLAVSVCFTLAPNTLPGGAVYADDITYTNSSADHQGTDDVGGFDNNYGVTISTDKSEYALGEDIYVKLEGFSNMGGGTWIGLFNNTGASDSHYWAYISGDFSGKVINNVDSSDALDGLVFQHTIEPGSYYVIAVDDDGRWAITPLTIKSSNTITTDKDRYAIDEPIMVTATSNVDGVWVSLLGKNDNVDAQSYYWYYVSEHNGDAFNIYEGTPSREADITDGEYKLVIIEDTAEGYKALAQKDVFIGTYVEPSITLNKEGSIPEYKYGEPVMATAQASDSSAWVGIYDYEPDFPDGDYARFNVKDVTGSVDLVQLAADAGKPLEYGKSYRVYLSILKDGNPNSWVKQVKFKLLDTYGDPTWQWDENFITATATFTAKHDSNVKKTVEVTGDGITSEVTKEATEEEEGIKKHTATITADMIDFTTENDPPFTNSKEEVIPKLSHVHEIVPVSAKDPTCTEPGNIAYYKCSGCNKFFEDEQGTKEIEDKNSVIKPATGHDWGEWVFDANTKTHSRVCNNDAEHKETGDCTFEHKPSSDPDIEIYTCTVCGGQYEQVSVPVITTDKKEYKVGEEVKVTTELNGHDGTTAGGWVALYEKGSVYDTSLLWYFPAEFDNPKVLQSVLTPSDVNKENLGNWPQSWGDTLPVGDYELIFLKGGKPYTSVGQPTYFSVVKSVKSEEVTKKPTCTEAGNKHVIYDDGTEEDVEIDPLGHDPKEEWVFDGEKRVHYHECNRCDERVEEAACTFDEGKVTKEPTAKEEGEMTYTCKICGGTYTEAIPALANQGVKRIYGDTRYETALLQADELKEVMGVEKFDAIILATGTNFADALSGSYLGYVKKAPILLVNKSLSADVKKYIQDNLKEGGTIYLLGGTAAIPASVEKELAGTKRLSGATRYETNIAILKEAGVKKEELMVCNGKNYPDSLSASAAKRPILLVNKALNKKQRDYLDTLRTTDYYIIGGTKALPEAIADDIESNYGTVKRLGGNTRYETSVMIAEEFMKDPTKAVLAYAKNYPDGLCGGTVAAYLDAPLILVTDDGKTAATEFAKKNGVKSGIVLGGEGLIADDTARTIFDMAADDEIYVIH